MRWQRYSRLAVITLVATGLAACGQQSTTGSSAAPVSSSNASIPASKELSHLQQVVTSAQADASQTFSPGPAISNMAALKGKKIMALPGTSLIPTCVQDVKVIQSIGDAAGTPVTIINTSGQVSQWESAIDLAIAQHYAAVDFICDDVPSIIGPEIEKAQSHGVKVFGYGLSMPLTQKNYPGLAGGTMEPIWNDYSTMIDQAFVKTGGKPFDMLVISSVGVIGNAADVAMLKAQVKQMCGSACNVTVVDIEVPDWGTKIQSTVQTQLLNHRNIGVVYPMFSGEYSFVLPAVEASHRSVLVTGAFGGGTPQIKLQTQSPVNNIIIGDMTSDPVWAAYEFYYQTMLGLAGQPMVPLNSTTTPNILATSANAQKVLSGAAWGDTFVNAYRQAFGLAPLSGSALNTAATVGS